MDLGQGDRQLVSLPRLHQVRVMADDAILASADRFHVRVRDDDRCRRDSLPGYERSGCCSVTAPVSKSHVSLIEPAAAADLEWLATRPAYSALTSERGTVMRSYDEALAAFAAHHEWRDRERLSA